MHINSAAILGILIAIGMLVRQARLKDIDDADLAQNWRIFIGIGAFVLALGINICAQNVLARWTPTIATVVLAPGETMVLNQSDPMVQFQTRDGKQIQTRLFDPMHSGYYSLSARIPLVYDPAHPTDVWSMDSVRGLAILVLIIGYLGLFEAIRKTSWRKKQKPAGASWKDKI
jgi:hypothetical protein